MNSNMKGRVVIVTGASEGIGRAVVERLAQEGAHVVGYARRAEPLAEMEKAVRDMGGSIETHILDVGNVDEYRTAIQDVHARHGRLDGLVNNAFTASAGPVTEISLKDWQRDFAVNNDSIFVGTQEAMRLMQPVGRGSIVNIASTAGTHGFAYMASYSASKAAMIMMSKVAATEGGPYNVRVNVASPGQIRTKGSAKYRESNPSLEEQFKAVTPMRRQGEVSEMANGIYFLLSDESSYITGAVLPVDGGLACTAYFPTAGSGTEWA
ncbi:SDR family NAD(P)-dependent oxidoreductase [Pseudomonas sp. H11T01]|uniref:SDR family NAD(P)-dependent oxidoreductase n=1 Tax=Pseudomonas sp. H11T01 TaxID=3402749 RepID=UPI003AC31AD8